MKIAPLKMTDPWFSRIASDGRADATMLRGVPCDIIVDMNLVEIGHHGPDLNFRPYLHMRGNLSEVHPDVELPYGIDELPFRSDGGGPKDSFYEFTDDQLSELAAKGYFTDRFRVPEAMIGIPWELPSTADFLIVSPESMEDAPMVFMGLHEQSTQVLHEADSGYRLADHFPDYTPEAGDRIVESERITETARVREDEMEDLFADDELVVDDHGRGRVLQNEDLGADLDEVDEDKPRVPGSLFARLMSELQEQHRAEDAARSVGVDYEPGSAEALWRDGVAPSVDEALSASQKHEPAVDEPEITEEVDDLFADEEALADHDEKDQTHVGRHSSIRRYAESLSEDDLDREITRDQREPGA